MEKRTVTLSYVNSDLVSFTNIDFRGSYSEITQQALMVSWVVSRGVNVLDKGTGFPDERFGDWGMIKCHDENQYLRAVMMEAA